MNIIPIVVTHQNVAELIGGEVASGAWWESAVDMSDANCTWGSHCEDNNGTTTVTDDSGANDITIDNASMWDATNYKFGARSISFDGTKDGVCGAQVNMTGGSRSWGAWVKTNEDFHTNGTGIILDPEGDNRFQIGCIAGRNNVVSAYYYDGGWTRIDGTTDITDNLWHFVMAVATDNGTVALYIDGSSDNTPVAVGVSQGTNAACLFGDASGGASKWHGNIDEVQVWDVAKSF
jgi:hypothetical protein